MLTNRAVRFSWQVFVALLITGFCLPVNAHDDDGYYHGDSDLPVMTDWMASLDDARQINTLSIPGTHDSGARYGGDSTATQTLTISQQLNAGVRFLDIRLRHIEDVFAIHHGLVYQRMMFGDVLNDVAEFLYKHPSETVFMRVKEEYDSSDTTRSFSETFKSYFDRYRNVIAAPVAENAPLESVRGKIVFLVNFPTSDYDFGIGYGEYDSQDAFSVSTNWDLYSKWEKVKDHLVKADDDYQSRGASISPYINYLTASGGSFPYFIASGHSSPGTSAPRLATGLTTPGWKNSYPDFPRVNCFIGICTIAFEGTNILTKNHIRNASPPMQYVGIVAADFPGAGLIKSIVDINFSSLSFVNRSNQKCLDIEKEFYPRLMLSTRDCDGSLGQAFTIKDEMIHVGDLCLDVEGNFNQERAQVIAFSCNGDKNQKWKLDTGGRIRSLMPGVARCLNPDYEYGGLITMEECSSVSTGQQFTAIKYNTHFASQAIVNKSNQKCLAIDDGNHRLITEDCNGSLNQLFTLKNDTIQVGDLCLDVEGNVNRRWAHVIAWACNGHANQKWRLDVNGTIRSLMPGEARCLDVDYDEEEKISMWECTPISDEQQFTAQAP